MSGKDKNLHNMSESDSEHEDVGKEGIEWIMNLPDVPMKLPPHVELQRTRVECKADAPIHVPFSSFSHVLFVLSSYSFFIRILRMMFNSMEYMFCFCFSLFVFFLMRKLCRILFKSLLLSLRKYSF